MRHAWATVAVVALATFQVAFTLSAVFVVFVDLGDYFPDASNAQLSWAINSFTIVSASTVVLGAALGDHWGRKRIALVGTALFAFGSFVAGTAPSVGVLIVGRCIQALGGAMSAPSGLALVLEAFPFEKRGIAIGTFTLGGGLAAAVGPGAGGLIVEHFGWRWAFLGIIPMGVLAVIMGTIVYEESYGQRRDRLPDPLGSVMLMSGVGSLILALVQTDEWGWADNRTVIAALVGLTLLGVLLRRSASHPSPIIDLGLYRRPSFRAGNTGTAIFSTSFFTIQFAAIFFLTDVWQYEIGRAGLLASPYFLALGLTGPVAGRIVDRTGPRPVVVTGAGLWTASVLALWTFVGEEPNVALWLPIVAIGGLGAGLFWGSAPTLSMEDLQGTEFARGSGINQTMQNIGNALAIAIAITLLGDEPTHAEFTPVFAFAVLVGVTAAAISWTGGPRTVSAAPRSVSVPDRG